MSAKAQVTPYHVHMHAWAHTHTRMHTAGQPEALGVPEQP